MASTATKSAPKSTQEKTDKATAQDAPDTAQTQETASDTAPTQAETPQQGGQLAATAATATAATVGDNSAVTTRQEQGAASMLPLDELATLYRVPSWQQAALARMQGWEPGKRVTAETYEAALTALGARPQGGR